MSDQRPWPKTLVDLVGRQVRRHRRQHGWSVRELSEELEKVGMVMEPPVITNLELGRRGTVSVAELLALGAALKTPPLLLVFPVGQVDEMEVLPAREVDPWVALQWALMGGGVFGANDWVIVGGGAVDLFHEHAEALHRWDRAAKVLDDSEATEQDKRSAERTQEAVASSVRSLRARMRQQQLTPPRWLPVALRYVDEQESSDG